MTTTSRQSNLLLNEDWTRIYQTFKSADFKSYDFENIRRVIISYFRVASIILLYSTLTRRSTHTQNPSVLAGTFLGGYLAAWAFFSL